MGYYYGGQQQQQLMLVTWSRAVVGLEMHERCCPGCQSGVRAVVASARGIEHAMPEGKECSQRQPMLFGGKQGIARDILGECQWFQSLADER